MHGARDLQVTEIRQDAVTEEGADQRHRTQPQGNHRESQVIGDREVGGAPVQGRDRDCQFRESLPDRSLQREPRRRTQAGIGDLKEWRRTTADREGRDGLEQIIDEADRPLIVIFVAEAVAVDQGI